MNLVFPMILMVPAVFIYLFFIWFLVVGIMEKNAKMIVIFGFITIFLTLSLGGFLLLCIQIKKFM